MHAPSFLTRSAHKAPALSARLWPCAVVVSLWGLCATSTAQAPVPAARVVSAAQSGLSTQPVRLAAAGRPLSEIQRQLETALGTRLVLSGSAPEAVVSGEVSGSDGLAFVRQLASQLRLSWALGPGEVYFGNEDSARNTVFVTPSTAIANRVASLASQEFEDQGSGIRLQAKREELHVTGLPGWMSQVAARRLPALIDEVSGRMRRSDSDGSDEPLSLMVFQLNNAYVDDKRLSVGSNVLVIPGVARLFRQFTGMPGGGLDVVPQAPLLQTSRLERLDRLDPVAGGRVPRGERTSTGNESDSVMEQVSVSMNRPAALADSRMNALVIRDKASRMETHRSLLKVLDQAASMVQLDAFVIDIKASRLDEFGLGLSWGGSSRVNSSAFGASGASPPSPNVILQSQRGVQLLAQIRALESNGDSEVLTVPSVVTLNNLEATFSARDNFYVKVTGNQDASLTKVTAETLLKVTPLVSNVPGSNPGDRRIRLLISVQDGQVDASESAVVDNLPRVLENQISTQAVVRGGDTLVIGGQVVRKRIRKVSGLPFISQLPLIGPLTSLRSEDVQSFVRIYVVRPRILGEDSEAVQGAAAGPQGADLHPALQRVPSLLQGNGLAPTSTPRTGGPSGAGATEPVIVPIPSSGEPQVAPLVPVSPAPAAVPATHETLAPATAAKPDTTPSTKVQPRKRGPVPRSDSSQRERDEHARDILERELRLAQDMLTIKEVEQLNGVPGSSKELTRVRSDIEALRRELQRLDSRQTASALR